LLFVGFALTDPDFFLSLAHHTPLYVLIERSGVLMGPRTMAFAPTCRLRRVRQLQLLAPFPPSLDADICVVSRSRPIWVPTPRTIISLPVLTRSDSCSTPHPARSPFFNGRHRGPPPLGSTRFFSRLATSLLKVPWSSTLPYKTHPNQIAATPFPQSSLSPHRIHRLA